MSDPFDGVDMGQCENLAERASRGDAASWTAFVERLWPAFRAMVRSNPSMAPLRGSEDDVSDVVTALLGKLGAQNGRGLRLYGAWRDRHPDKTFEDWLRIVTKNVIRDHIRERLRQRSERATQGEVTVKSLTNEFARSPAIERLGLRPRMTAAQTARQLLEFAASHLPADQYRALTLWIQGASFDDIGAELAAPGPDAGRNLVRAAVAVLRRQFGASGA